MPVLSTEKMWSRRNSNAQYTENYRKLSVSFTEAYSIVTTFDTTEFEVYTQSDIPAAGTSFPGFPYVVADQAQLERISPILWIATLNYSGEIAGVSTGSQNENPVVSPLAAPPRITIDDVEAEEEIDQDYDGFPIATPAGERVRGIKARIPDQTLTVTRNLLTFNSYVQSIYRRSVNSDSFFGWPPGTCKLMKLTANNVIDQTLGYWVVTGVFQFRYPYNTTADKAWFARWPAMGFYQLDSNGEQVPCVDGNRNPVATPAYIDQNGKQTTADNVFFVETKLYGSLPYRSLGLL